MLQQTVAVSALDDNNTSLTYIDDAAEGMQQSYATMVPKQSSSTFRITLSVVRVLMRWLAENRGETRLPEHIPAPELNAYLEDLWPSLRKADGSKYTLTTFPGIRSRLNSYLREKSGGRLSLDNSDFETSNMAFAKAMESLRLQLQ